MQNGPRSKNQVAAASGSLGFGQKHDAIVDIPLDTMNVCSVPLSYVLYTILH